MKKIYLLFLAAALTLSAQSQLVIDESFDVAGTIPAGWTAIDEDGLTPSIPGQENWIVDTVQTTFYAGRVMAISLSWMQGYAPGNRNWMISPAIDVASSDFQYAWAACPSQGTLYMDGYKIMLSTTGTELADFTVELANFAQNINDTPNEFSDGIVHDGFDGDETTTTADGILRHYTVDLSAYDGQTVYVAILHDSDDDARLYLDYVKVGPAADIVSVDELTGRTFEVNVFPNPTSEVVNISFDSNQEGEATLNIINTVGQVIETTSIDTNSTEEVSFDVSEYAAGIYIARLTAEGNVIEKRFVVE